MPTVERFELLHLGERQTEHLELLNELEPSDIVVGVHALTAIEALDRFEEAPLLVIADGPLGHPDLRGQLPDPIARRRLRRHVRQFTSTGRLLPVWRSEQNEPRLDSRDRQKPERWPGIGFYAATGGCLTVGA